MPIADSHCHASLSWYEPIEALLFQMERNGVDHAALIQMQGQYDNGYQAECVRRYPGKFASVVIVDPSKPDAAERLAEEVRAGATGVRLRPQDPLALWQAAERLGLSVSCGGSSTAFAAPEFAAILERVSGVPIVIEHLGSINRPDDDTQHELRRAVFGLSRFPNAHIKIHGLGEFQRRAMPATDPFPFVTPVAPALEWAYDAFGPNRMMWGSDFPPVSSREGYANALRLPMEQLAGKSQADRDAIFGGTALRVFPVR